MSYEQNFYDNNELEDRDDIKVEIDAENNDNYSPRSGPPEQPNKFLMIFLALLLLIQIRSDRLDIDESDLGSGGRGLRNLLQVYARVQARSSVQVSDEELYRGAIDGMLSVLNDPYTNYLAPREATFQDDMISDKAVGGIGAEILVRYNGDIVLGNLYPAGAAAEAGMQRGDKIITIDNKVTNSMKYSDLLAAIRGPIGSQVQIEVLRAGEEGERIFTLKRRELPHSNRPTSKIIDTGKGKVGYIRLPLFISGSADMIDGMLESFKKEEVVGVLLDLRNNAGGAMDEAIKIADIFIDKGVIIWVERGGKEKRRSEYLARSGGTGVGMRLMVLVNHNSASASELVSAALQDNNVAFIVGEKTYGKGRIQEMYPLPDGSTLRLTTAQFLTPNGNVIDRIGIRPDLPVASEGRVISGAPLLMPENITTDPYINTALGVMLGNNTQ